MKIGCQPNLERFDSTFAFTKNDVGWKGKSWPHLKLEWQWKQMKVNFKTGRKSCRGMLHVSKTCTVLVNVIFASNVLILSIYIPCWWLTDLYQGVFYFRHALPLFTSLLNIVCSYDPVGYGVPYNHLMFLDSREPLVEVALQVLCVTLENEAANQNVSVDGTAGGTAMENGQTDVRFMY